MMRNRFHLLVLTLLLTFLLVPRASAESAERVTRLKIQIWPEYDDPTVLVQYDGELVPQTGFPREVSLFIPTGANVIASAYVDANGQFLNTDPWRVQDAGDGWSRILVTLPSPRFHIEYYFNPLHGATDKTMEFIYRAAQPTDAVHVEIQQPLKAEKFVTVPAGDEQTNRTHGFTYHLIDFPALEVDKTVNVKVSYTKNDPNPSIAFISVPDTNAPNASNSAAAPSAQTLVLPAILVSIGLALGVLGVYYWYSRRQIQTARAYGRTESKRGRRRAGESASAFCWNCGNALDKDDNFCANCGAKRR